MVEPTDLIFEQLKQIRAQQKTDSGILSQIQQDVVMLRSAVNDLAGENVTPSKASGAPYEGVWKDFTEDKFVASVQRDHPNMTRKEILKWLHGH
jgi:hypothetical protein